MNQAEATTTQFELTDAIRGSIELVLQGNTALTSKDKESFNARLIEWTTFQKQRQERLEREQQQLVLLEQQRLQEEEEVEHEHEAGESEQEVKEQSEESTTATGTTTSRAEKKRQQKKKNKKNKKKQQKKMEQQEEEEGDEETIDEGSGAGVGIGGDDAETSQQGATQEESIATDVTTEEEIKPTISLALLMRLSEILVGMKKSKNTLPEGQPVYLHELTKGSQLIVKRLPQRVKDPVNQEKLRLVKIQIENRQYERMTKRISGETNQSRIMEDHAELKSYKSQMEIGINVIATMATLFVGGYYLTKVITGNHLLGLAVGLIAGAAGLMMESWLFVIAGNRIDKRVEERKRRLKKIQRPLLTNEIPIELRSKPF